MAISRGETPQRTSRGIQRLRAAAASSRGERSLPRSASAELAQGAAARCAAPGPVGRCRAARGEGAGSARRLPCAPPALRACPPSAAGAGPPSRAQSGRSCGTFVRHREPRSDVDQGEEAEDPPRPPSRPEAGPAHPRLGLGLPFSFCPLSLPTPSLGLAWAAGRREQHLHHGSGDHPGHHFPWGLDPTSGAGGRRAWRTKLPTAGHALAGSSCSPGPCWSPRSRARYLRAAARAARRSVPRPSADPPRSQPAPPLRSADRRRRRVGGDPVWAAGLRGLGGRDPGPPHTASGPGPLRSNLSFLSLEVSGISTWLGGVVVAGGWGRGLEGRGCQCVCAKNKIVAGTLSDWTVWTRP